MHTNKIGRVMIYLLLSSRLLGAVDEVRDEKFEVSYPSKDGDTIQIKITSTTFDKVDKDTTLNAIKGHTIDGRSFYQLYGTDRMVPTADTELINSFEVTFGKKKIKVPKPLWAGCCYPSLQSPKEDERLPSYAKTGGVDVFISPDRKMVCITMTGYRSASAPYRVMWTVGSNGMANRWIENVLGS